MDVMKTIAPRLNYWPAASPPLCADIFVYEGRDCAWVFDVGYGQAALRRVQSLPGKFAVVISHFHQDHIGNLPELNPERLYLGQYTLRHTGSGQVVDTPMEPEPGLRLFSIPSIHAKGCVGMEVEGQYALLGDATYCAKIKGRPAYNATLLFDTIRTLNALNAPYFLLSHGEPVVRPREDVLGELNEIYSLRIHGQPYIYLD